MKAVILAGGKGSRLKPYTTSFPKPLMPIGDKPILEILVRQLSASGQKDIILAVGHLAELIISFLGDGRQYGVTITYSREDTQLGTIGPLTPIKDKLKETFLVINGDTLTDLNYSKLLLNHKNSNCLATIALTKREMEIAICFKKNFPKKRFVFFWFFLYFLKVGFFGKIFLNKKN
ncbi:UTP--glucose-1-phosphate uridylyltransferase AglF [uncultured archaeon]|nr:UTP--glucose-1-phosphate uridylyltransferase AglF [uncultured archaeon]